MARASSQINDAEDVKRTIYVSWRPDPLASEVFEALNTQLKLYDWDAHDRELRVVSNDPERQAGEESAQIRRFRAETTDFVAIFTSNYLAAEKENSDADEAPDLIYFIQAKSSDDATDTPTMWIFPAEAIALRLVSFRNANIRHIEFDWWHGWAGEDDTIPFSDGSKESIKIFKNDIKRRTVEILNHPEDS